MPTGFLLDKIGRRKLLLAGPIISALASFAIFFADSFPELLVYRFISGWGQQMWMLSRLTVIADTGGAYQRG
jgi:MFS family permease